MAKQSTTLSWPFEYFNCIKIFSLRIRSRIIPAIYAFTNLNSYFTHSRSISFYPFGFLPFDLISCAISYRWMTKLKENLKCCVLHITDTHSPSNTCMHANAYIWIYKHTEKKLVRQTHIHTHTPASTYKNAFRPIQLLFCLFLTFICSSISFHSC